MFARWAQQIRINREQIALNEEQKHLNNQQLEINQNVLEQFQLLTGRVTRLEQQMRELKGGA